MDYFDSVIPYDVLLSIFTQQQWGLEMHCPFFCLHNSWDFHTKALQQSSVKHKICAKIARQLLAQFTLIYFSANKNLNILQNILKHF